MPTRCVVAGCSNTPSEGVSLHTVGSLKTRHYERFGPQKCSWRGQNGSSRLQPVWSVAIMIYRWRLRNEPSQGIWDVKGTHTQENFDYDEATKRCIVKTWEQTESQIRHVRSTCTCICTLCTVPTCPIYMYMYVHCVCRHDRSTCTCMYCVCRHVRSTCTCMYCVCRHVRSTCTCTVCAAMSDLHVHVYVLCVPPCWVLDIINKIYGTVHTSYTKKNTL